MLSGGRSYVTSAPAFSNDGKKFLVCSSNVVCVFSTATGLQITSLEGHTALVTAVIVVPALTPASKLLCYCWTASLDGTIRHWDFSGPEMMKIVNIQMPVFSMVIPSFLGQPDEDSRSRQQLFAYVSVEDTKKPKEQTRTLHRQIRKCNLTKCRLVSGVILVEMREPEVIAISPSGKYFGIKNKCKLHIWEVPDVESEHVVVRTIKLHHTRRMTILAFHPTGRIVAAGDATGRILIWRSFGNKKFGMSSGHVNERVMDDGEEKPGVRGNDDADSCSTWHWHPSEINILSFSSDGAYLYSGGKEGVLVVWQLETGEKKFLPRIGSPLLYFIVSPDPSLALISCADNQLHLLKMPSMQTLKTIPGIKAPYSYPEICKGLSSGIAFDQISGLVVLRTENYSVQLYSLFDDRGISEVQVCERNHQPCDDVMVVVTLVALSPDGSAMSTAEVKLAEDGIGGLVCLKFWVSGSQSKDYTLSTIVYEPHRDANISAITFHPFGHMAASSSYGGDFKVWICNCENLKIDQMVPNSSWTCHSVGSYKEKPMTAAAFSNDGSVLAVAAENIITLWNAEKNVLLAVIGETSTPIVSLSFVGKSEFLVAASCGSRPQLSVWNMSSLLVSWSYMLHVEAIACAADLSSFAVLSLLPESARKTSLGGRDGVILLFNATETVPLGAWSVQKAKGGALAFLQVNTISLEGSTVDGKMPQALLTFVNGDHEYVVFDPFNKEAHELGITRKRGLIEETVQEGQIGYASIYGEIPKLNLKTGQTPRIPSLSSERPWETIFSGSSHSLPPVHKLCSAFLGSFLEKRTFVE